MVVLTENSSEVTTTTLLGTSELDTTTLPIVTASLTTITRSRPLSSSQQSVETTQAMNTSNQVRLNGARILYS